MNAILYVQSLSDLSDEDLVERARPNGEHRDECAMNRLMEKYATLVHIKAKGFFLIGADREDLIQEGLIGLYKAVRDYKPDKSTFKAFADMCVNRQIITAVKTATRQKHQFLNHSVSIDKPIDGEERTLLDVLPDASGTDPLLQIERREVSEDIRHRILAELSDLEQDVLTHYLSGQSYTEIASEMQRGVKSIDNALQRAKRKIGESIISVR